MPRLGRVVLSDYAHQVAQRGHNKQVVFTQEADFRYERATRYRAFVHSAIPVGEWALIREALQRGQVTGTKRFLSEIEAIIGQRIESRKQGRPRKDTDK